MHRLETVKKLADEWFTVRKSYFSFIITEGRKEIEAEINLISDKGEITCYVVKAKRLR